MKRSPIEVAAAAAAKVDANRRRRHNRNRKFISIVKNIYTQYIYQLYQLNFHLNRQQHGEILPHVFLLNHSRILRFVRLPRLIIVFHTQRGILFS